MIGTVIANIFRFVLLVLVQAMVIDHVDLANGWVVPYLYVLFIILLPFDTPGWATLVLSFALGMAMDFFSSTPGLHAAACTAMAFARLLMLRVLTPREGYDPGKQPTVQHMGLAWFMTFGGTLVLVHHLVLFFLEVYRFTNFGSTFLRALMSVAATLVLCLLAQALSRREVRVR
ncbi:MAG: rod shape-determining protein MreD [Flavobacteriales bacterium]|nr:rod shape-determining protein MreD [Flavobacteriales bacterium]